MSIAAQCQRAYRLGSADAAAGRPMRDMADDGSAWLMSELGETTATGQDNYPGRLAMCDAYTDGYSDAMSALG